MTGERLWLVGPPAAAIAIVALGLRLGAPGDARAAVVYGGPASRGGNARAWQIFVFDENDGAREPLERTTLDVVARAGGREARWSGATNDDGVAECLLPLLDPDPVWLEVRTGGAVLAAGSTRAAPPDEPAPTASPWMQFVRREGPIDLDAALVGGRVAPGFASVVWARATDAATRSPLADVDVELDGDSGITPPIARARTDSRGWASLVVTPVGLAVSVTLRARSHDRRTGEAVGDLAIAPGAPAISTHARWSPDEGPEIDLTEPAGWHDAYVEVDDAHGRAWATTVSPEVARGGGTTSVGVHLPPLAPGLYRAVASAAPFGATEAEARSASRSFFVAAGDEAALAFGADADACAPPRDVREIGRSLSTCLALSAPAPTPRWVALDGFAEKAAHDRARRTRGVEVALGGLLVATLLEAALLLRAGSRSRARFLAETQGHGGAREIVPPRLWGLVLAVLVALLGFVLLAAFIVRVG